MLHVYAKIKKR